MDETNRGIKRSSSHLDMEELPGDSEAKRDPKIKPSHFEVLALLRRVMLATAHKRTQSEIERAAELTRVEREPSTFPSRDLHHQQRETTESYTSSSFDEHEVLEEECSDAEEVFEKDC